MKNVELKEMKSLRWSKLLCLALYFFFLFTLLLIHSFTNSVSAQRVNVNFKEKQTLQKSNELASNMLRVVNSTTKKLNFSLALNLPDGWTKVGSSNTEYSLDGGDSVFIPVRLIFKGRDEGDISYMVVASLISEANHVQFASASWSLQIKKESDWIASVDKTEAFFINNSDTSSFKINIQNTGNSTEWLTVRFTPHMQLQVESLLKNGETRPAGAFINVSLWPGQDTSLYFIVKHVEAQKTTSSKSYSPGENQTRSSEKYPVRVLVQAQQKDNIQNRVWKTTVDFVRTSNEARFNDFNRAVLPLTVEMNMDNFLQSAAVLNFNLYGNASLKGSRTLSYRFQSYFTDQFLNTKAYKGNYHYLGYFTPKGGIEVGNITGWGGFGQTPSGVGTKGEYKFGQHKVGLFYIQNPELFRNPSVRSEGLNHQVEFKSFTVRNYYQHQQNELYKTSSDLAITGADFRLMRRHQFSIRAGGSSETHGGALVPFSTQGVGGNFNYAGNYNDFNFRLSSSYGSKYYTGYRGMANLNYNLSYKVNPKYTWTLNNAFYRQNPVYFDAAGLPLRRFNNRTDRYELMLGIRDIPATTPGIRSEADNSVGTSSYNLKAAYYYDDLMSIRYYTRGFGADYRTMASMSSRFTVSVFGSYIKLPDYRIPDYFTAQVRAGYHLGSLSTNIRYYYGPYQAFEQLQFATYGINHQSIFINSFYGFWIKKDRVSMEPSLNYSYESLYKRTRLSLRPELNYFSPGGLKLNVYAEYIINKQKIFSLTNTTLTDNVEAPVAYKNLLLGLSLKKSFGIPLPGKKYATAQVVVFKDLNGNIEQDKNEQGLENTLVVIKPVLPEAKDNEQPDYNFETSISERGESLITDDKGRVVFRNLPPGTYKLTAMPLVKNADWFAATEQTIVLTKSREVLLPFNHGVRLTGTISVDHNLVSTQNQNPDLSRIRITALDSAGHVYSTLTGNDGRFELYVPAGRYRVSVNQKVIDEHFEMPQSVMVVDLTGITQSYNVSFHLREKERVMKVRKFNSDGQMIEEK